jgi:hypothetical protein
MPAAEKEKGVRPDGGPRRCDTHESVIARNAETNKKTRNANRVARVLRPQRLLSRPTLPGRELLLLPPPSQCITRAPLVRIQHHYTHTHDACMDRRCRRRRIINIKPNTPQRRFVLLRLYFRTPLSL